MTLPIETERLILRELLPTDDEGMFALNSDPLVHKYLGTAPFTTIDQSRAIIDMIRGHYRDFGIGRWAVIEKSSGDFIGWTGLKFMNTERNGHINFIDVGYRFIPKYWGKGYATETAQASLEYAFTTMQQDMVYAMTAHDNHASRHVLEKCGLHVVETFDYDGETLYWLSISKDEWLKQRIGLPDFAITSQESISQAFLARKIFTFHQAIDYVRNLPYGRNSNKADLTSLFRDQCGTCSTKHAILKKLAGEHHIHNLKLIIGIFRMNARNTPEIANTLQASQLEYIPEAHCYLTYQDCRYDYTKKSSAPADFEGDLMEEIEIQPEQITDFKVEYHKKVIADWLAAHPAIKYSPEELWAIREKCIGDLAAQL